MATQAPEAAPSIDEMRKLAQQLRVDSIRASTAAGSGHPSSSMSAADLMAVLLAKYLRYDFNNPDNPDNDHLIFSKGHASPLLYSLYKAAGAISDEQLMSFRKMGSIFEGHPTPKIPWVDVATGSLGFGFPVAVGVAMAGQYLDKLPYRVWVLLGDGETAEGSVWEAFDKGSFYKLNNIIAIIDDNRLGQTGPTELGWDMADYKARVTAFGWQAIEIDGNDIEQVDKAYQQALDELKNGPVCIIAKTQKGAGVKEIANQLNWHGKALPEDLAQHAIQELGGEPNITVKVHQPPDDKPAPLPAAQPFQPPTYKVGDSVAIRKGFADGLAALGAANPRAVVLDADVGNSTYTEEFGAKYPHRFFQMYIAENMMVGGAVGMQVMNWVPFTATFGAFYTRAYDFVRMAEISQANLNLDGTHAGVSIGEDGPSQMALQDIAMMRAVHDSVVLYPSDAGAAAKLAGAMAQRHGVNYIRTTREKTPIFYGPDEEFHIGGCKVLRQSDKDQVTVIGAGITLVEAMKAYDQLQSEGISIRVIDLYSVKPLDVETVHAAIGATGNKVVTVEDHYPQGGLGDAVYSSYIESGSPAPEMIMLAVNKMPMSATPEQLLAYEGIDAPAIVQAVKQLAGGGKQGS